VNISGKIKENLKENGKIIKWMEMEFLNGQMEGHMKVNMKMIKNMVLVFLNGKKII